MSLPILFLSMYCNFAGENQLGVIIWKRKNKELLLLFFLGYPFSDCNRYANYLITFSSPHKFWSLLDSDFILHNQLLWILCNISDCPLSMKQLLFQLASHFIKDLCRHIMLSNGLWKICLLGQNWQYNILSTDINATLLSMEWNCTWLSMQKKNPDYIREDLA